MAYVNKSYLATQFTNFADRVTNVFSKLGHSHTKADITDFPGVEAAAQEGTTESLVNTGEKYEWNSKTQIKKLDTMEEYNALTDEEKNSDVLWIVENATPSDIGAIGISYDNSTSGLEAATVQGAIDETITTTDTKLSNKIESNQFVNFSYTYDSTTVSASSSVTINPTNSLPSNYIPIAIYSFATYNSSVVPRNFYAHNGDFALRNVSSSEQTFTPVATIKCIKISE